VQVKHLRCCYNILAALQESYDCNLLPPLVCQSLIKCGVLGSYLLSKLGSLRAREVETRQVTQLRAVDTFGAL